MYAFRVYFNVGVLIRNSLASISTMLISVSPVEISNFCRLQSTFLTWVYLCNLSKCPKQLTRLLKILILHADLAASTQKLLTILIWKLSNTLRREHKTANHIAMFKWKKMQTMFLLPHVFLVTSLQRRCTLNSIINSGNNYNSWNS